LLLLRSTGTGRRSEDMLSYSQSVTKVR
jgi:hypothetical protein